MLKELNHVVEYIEEHLTEDITLEEISQYAGVSDYHFRKIFYYLSGLPLSEYIKNRKLSEANKDLLKEESRIVIYDSILMAVRVEDIKKAVEMIALYRKGGAGSEDTEESTAD